MRWLMPRDDTFFVLFERSAATMVEAAEALDDLFSGGPIDEEEIPDVIDSPSTGLPAGRDKESPPAVSKLEPYKTHLAYVKERRTEEEAAALLEEALQQLRARRGTAAKD